MTPAEANAEYLLTFDWQNCQHERTAIKRRICSDGRVQFVRECVRCFKSSNPIKASEANGNEPPVTQVDWEHYHAARRETRETERNSYYKSASWKTVRNAAMKRDNYECQECGRPATEVHHLSYVHIGDERLYELVSLCRSCHQEISVRSGHGQTEILREQP